MGQRPARRECLSKHEAYAGGRNPDLSSDSETERLKNKKQRLLVANGIEGLVFDPFGPVLDVTYATKG